MSTSLSRRDLLKCSAAAGCAWAARASAPTALSELGYEQIRFADGPLQRQVNQNHQLLLDLNEDSLLRPFRVREGLPAPGAELGGWYSTEAFAPGANFGQWLSALARHYAISGDPAAREKVNRLVAAFAKTVEPSGKFYTHNRFPSYTYDKLVCGLIDAHTFARNPLALDILPRVTNAAEPYLPPHAVPRRETEVLHDEDFTEHCWDESYTIPENQFLAWERTGNTRYRDLATRFLYNDGFFYPLAHGENVLPGKHAYSHVNALCSSAKAYLALGDPRHLDAARNGFALVSQQSYVTGGWGPDEHFFDPGTGKLGETLKTTHSSFETPCGSYAHLKLTRYLLRITRVSKYGDSMERVLYNTVLGAKPIQRDGAAFYYSDYNFDAHKIAHPDKWPCCSGTLPQVTADYRIGTYFQDDRGLYVNLYVPSTVKWSQGQVTQITEYPYDSRIEFRVDSATGNASSIFLRIPEWAHGASVSVNGKLGAPLVQPGTFAELHRAWKHGDRIELILPLTMRTAPVDRQHPNTVALLCGPLVLMALKDGLPSKPTQSSLLEAQRRTPSAHEWLVGQSRFMPFADIQDQKYSTYIEV